mgnify:CR=1 FL=1
MIPVDDFKHARDIEESVAIVNCICYLHEFEGEASTLIGKGFTQAGDAECLAGRATAQHFGRRDFSGQHAPGDGGHVAQVGRCGVVVHQEGGREGLDLSQPGCMPAQWVPGNAGGFDATAHRSE